MNSTDNGRIEKEDTGIANHNDHDIHLDRNTRTYTIYYCNTCKTKVMVNTNA